MQGRWVRRRADAALVVMVALVTAVGLFSAPASATAEAAAGGWHVAATLGLGAEDTSVSCHTTTSCWALEAGELVFSDDGGATWADETALVPAGISALADLDCPTVSSCYLTAVQDAGDPVILVLDAAAGQITVGPVLGSEPLVISCAAARHCMASNGKQVYVSHDAAQTWKTSSPAAFVYSSPALSCVTATSTCWLVGNNGETPVIERTTNDGKSWQLQSDHAPPPPQTDGIYGVDCPSTQVCYIAGANMPDDAILLGTTDAGETWKLLDMPRQDYAVYSVSCSSTTTCWASGLPPAGQPSMYATTDGLHWTAQTLPAVTVLESPEVSCPADGQCVAVAGGIAFDTTDGGDTWGSTELPAVAGAPQGLTCATAKVCLGVSNDALGRPTSVTSSDGGSTWNRHLMSPDESSIWDVDCPSVLICYAMSNGLPGRPGAVITHAFLSTDGGQSWHSKVITRKGDLTRVTCPDTTTCLAAGFNSHSAAMYMVTTDSGASWQLVPSPPDSFYMLGVSCTSATACVVVTQDVDGPAIAWTTDDLGATYEPHELPAERDYYNIGCSGMTCVAVGHGEVGGALVQSTDGGVTWRSKKLPSNLLLGTVTCGSASACAATGFIFGEGSGPVIVGTTNTGRTWKVFRVPARQQQPTDVACVGARCIASDTSLAGNPLVLAGRA